MIEKSQIELNIDSGRKANKRLAERLAGNAESLVEKIATNKKHGTNIRTLRQEKPTTRPENLLIANNVSRILMVLPIEKQ